MEAPSHWDPHLDLLPPKGVAENARRWYASHAEGFLVAVRPRRLRSLHPEHINAYSSKVSAEGKLADWRPVNVVNVVGRIDRVWGIPITPLLLSLRGCEGGFVWLFP